MSSSGEDGDDTDSEPVRESDEDSSSGGEAAETVAAEAAARDVTKAKAGGAARKFRSKGAEARAARRRSDATAKRVHALLKEPGTLASAKERTKARRQEVVRLSRLTPAARRKEEKAKAHADLNWHMRYSRGRPDGRTTRGKAVKRARAVLAETSDSGSEAAAASTKKKGAGRRGSAPASLSSSTTKKAVGKAKKKKGVATGAPGERRSARRRSTVKPFVPVGCSESSDSGGDDAEP